MFGSNKNNYEIILEFDSNCYSVEAITFAAYDFMARASIKIKKLENKTLVYIMHKDHTENDLDKISSDFNDSVLDHQTRFLINNEFRLIREIIVAQAFQPCDDIKDILNAIKNE